MEDLSPIEWALRPIKQYAVFSGRAARAEYWWYYLATVVVGLLLRLIDGLIDAHGVLSAILNIALFLPWISVTVRRLHDTNRSGWWLLILGAGFLVVGLFAGVLAASGHSALGTTTVIGAVLLLLAAVVTLFFFMVLPGTNGPNDYGSDPYGPNNLEEVFA